MILNHDSNEESNLTKKNKKVLRPETAKVLKVNDNFKDIDKLNKFQLETEVPYESILLKDKIKILNNVLQTEHVLMNLYEILFPFNKPEQDINDKLEIL